MDGCNFTFKHYEEIFAAALRLGYQTITLHEYFSGAYDATIPTIVNRIDIDVHIGRIGRIARIFSELGIKATFFPRIHSKDYNLFTFSWFNQMKELIGLGHEIGIHSEIIDMQVICEEDPARLVHVEKKMMEDFFTIPIYGFASHGDFTGNNNLDFWKTHTPKEFGLEYEAYDESLWNNCRYVADSEVIRWKTYKNGKLANGDNRCICQHLPDKEPLLYLLTHPESYYDKHFHEIP